MHPFGNWNWWSFYWLVVWFGIGFLVPEGIALWKNPSNTLSDQVWRLEGSFGAPWTWSAAHFFIAAGCIWLAFHFIDHIWA